MMKTDDCGPHLNALVVRAVGLRPPEQRQQPAHGHLVIEDALARVEVPAVSHGAVFQDFFNAQSGEQLLSVW